MVTAATIGKLAITPNGLKRQHLIANRNSLLDGRGIDQWLDNSAKKSPGGRFL
jgi:hypothetical protein